MLYDKIREDFKNSLKLKKRDDISVLRMLLGDIQRKPDKDYNDEYVISVVNENLNDLNEVDTDQSEFEKSVLNRYLPKLITEQEIIDYVNTIDFSKTNPNVAIGQVKRHFPVGSVNGKDIRDIITKIVN